MLVVAPRKGEKQKVFVVFIREVRKHTNVIVLNTKHLLPTTAMAFFLLDFNIP